jgi:hypothetical protein
VQYLPQIAALRLIDQLFESKGIAYAAIKGSHVRELVYAADPSLRPACDIDILVPFGQRLIAAQALAEVGFRYCPEPKSINYEADLSQNGVHVDLHWNLFRDGRSRIDFMDSFIAHRSRMDGFWGLSDTDAMFLMLTHPAFSKYICTPKMGLSRVVDFMRWVELRKVDWDAVAMLLDNAGLKTAAWAILSWFAMLGVALPDVFERRVQPSNIRARYIFYWLEQDLPTKWLFKRKLFIQFGLTLFFHDRFSDACRATCRWLCAYLVRHRDPFAHLLVPEAQG